MTEQFVYWMTFGLTNLLRVIGTNVPRIVADWILYSACLIPILFGAAMLLHWFLRLFMTNKGNVQLGLARQILCFLFESIGIGLVRAVIIGVLLALYAIGFIRPAA